MRTEQSINLPLVGKNFEPLNEEVTRRTIEQYLQSLHGDIATNETKKSGQGSRALRRFQFLLMGAR